MLLYVIFWSCLKALVRSIEEESNGAVGPLLSCARCCKGIVWNGTWRGLLPECPSVPNVAAFQAVWLNKRISTSSISGYRFRNSLWVRKLRTNTSVFRVRALIDGSIAKNFLSPKAGGQGAAQGHKKRFSAHHMDSCHHRQPWVLVSLTPDNPNHSHP